MKNILLWQQKIISFEEELDNEELLIEVLQQAYGDSWDGAFTDRGQWEFNYLKLKLRERLQKIGFIK